MTPLQLLAPINLKAAEAGKARRFKILAYSGGMLRVEGFQFPVVVDLAGLEANAVSVVLDHQVTTDATVGQVETITNTGKALLLAGTVTGQSARVREVLAAADAGQQWQASIGALVESQQEIQAGQTVFVNGQQFCGPIIVARRSVLRETSVLPVGADSSTTVNLAAAAATLKGNTMPTTAPSVSLTFDEWLAERGIDPTTLTPEITALLTPIFDAEVNGEQPAAPAPAVAAATALMNLQAAANITRITAINRIASGHPLIATAAIQKNWSAVETENHVLKANQRMHSPSNFIAHGGTQIDEAKVIEASVLLSQGIGEKFLGKHFDQPTINAAMAKENRGQGIHHVVNASLRAAGKSTGWQKVGTSQISAALNAGRMIRAGSFSTVSMPGILGNAGNKLLLNAYEAIPTTWRLFAGIQSAKDFKAYTFYRFTVTGELSEVGPGGEIKHLTLDEAEYSNQLSTRGGMITLTRQTIINDDLGAFAAIPRNFGRLAAVGLEKAVYKKLLGNVGTIFTADRGNYFDGAGSVLSIEQLGVAERKFLDQTDDNGDPLLIVPSLLGVPSALSATSAVLTRDTSIQQPTSITTGTSTGNPHSGKFQPFVSPWFGNANLAGYSNTHWFLFGTAPEQGVINVGFLDGVQTPTIEDSDVDFSQLGMSWRVYFDFGVGIGDYRFGVRSKGAA